MKYPQVSVIMPCYNCETTVSRAVESILNQTLEAFELILINDGSTDSTGALLEKISRQDDRIVLLHNYTNMGLAYSLNKGIRVAKADIIARMDADDWAFENRLSKQHDYLTLHDEIDILGCAILNINTLGQELGIAALPIAHEDIISQVFKKPLVYHPTIMTRKCVYQNFGYYDERLRWAEDADLWYRIYDKVRFHNLEEALIIYTTKTRLSRKVIFNNLKVKYINLKRRALLKDHIHILVKDLIIMTVKMVRNF